MTLLARLSDSNEPDNTGQRLSQFSSGELRDCPICAIPAEEIYCWHGIEYVVLYVRPCGCRLGCRDNVPQWAEDAGIAEHDYALFGADEEPTVEQLIEDGIEVELLPEHYLMIYESQERAGQKRLPLNMDDTDDDAGENSPLD